MIFPPLYPLARKQIERVRKLPLGDDLGSRQLLGLLAFDAARTLGDRATCVEYAERAVAGGALFSQDNPAFAFSTVTLTVADSWERPRGIFDDAFADARIRGSISAFAVASIFRGYLHVFTGDLTEAEADLQNAVDASRQHGLASGLPYALAFLADAQMQRGDLEAAIETLAQVDALPELAREHAFVYDARGRLRFLQGRYRDALAEFEKGRQVYEAVGGTNPAVVAWRSQSALAHHQLGETEEAKRLAADEVELARRWGAPRALAKALRVAGMIEGGEEGLALLEEAVALLHDSEAILERARGCSSSARRSGARTAAPTPVSTSSRPSSSPTAASRRARGPCPGRADGHRGPPAPRGAQRPRRAHPERAAGRRDGRQGAHEPGHRPGALRHPQDGRGAPLERLPQARDRLEGPARGGARLRGVPAGARAGLGVRLTAPQGLRPQNLGGDLGGSPRCDRSPSRRRISARNLT